MNLPQIHEIFIKILQGGSSKNTQEDNVGAIKGKGEVIKSTKNGITKETTSCQCICN